LNVFLTPIARRLKALGRELGPVLSIKKAAAMPAANHCHALIIGIADYPHVRKLPPVSDARDIASLLQDPVFAGYPSSQVRLLEEGQATREALRKELARLASNAGPEATVFFYFSGHGGRVESGAGQGQYLLPADTICAREGDLVQTAIADTEFGAALNAIRAERLTVVLDCCHAGGIGEVRDLTAVELRPGLSDGYLDQLKAGRGRVILAAARSTEPAFVRPGDRNGVFTHHLLDGLRGGAVGSGGVIRILDLFHYVQQNLARDQPNQHPLLKAELEENYPIALFRGGQRPPPAPPAAADAFAYDAFLSYRDQEPDRSWVRKKLVPRLKEAGIRFFIDYRDFRIGAPLLTEMERGVQQSRYTVAVLSPLYLQSGFNEFEGLIARHLGLEQSQRRFMGVLRQRCTPSLGVRALYYLDLSDDDEFDDGVDRLIDQVRQPLALGPAAG
jgi:hypothetical protein